MEIIRLSRRGGKTTKCLEILRDNEKSVMIQHCDRTMSDLPIMQEHPEIRRRIFSYSNFREKLRGRNIEIVVIDNADILCKEVFFDIIHYLTTHPLNMGDLCKIVLTITDYEKTVESQENVLNHMHDIVMKMFMDSCEILSKENLDDKSFKFCIDSIHNTTEYLQARRRSN